LKAGPMNDDRHSPEPKFDYRKNKDDTIDSICLQCFLTVCSCAGSCEDSCAPAEREHKCHPLDVARVRIKGAE